MEVGTDHQEATQIRTRPTFKAVIIEALRVKYYGLAMDPLIRRVVHEELERMMPQVINQTAIVVCQQMRGELERATSQIVTQTGHFMRQQVEHLIAQFLRCPQLHIEEAEPASNLQLVFTKELIHPIYSDDEIKDKDNNHLKVALMRIEHGQSSAFSLDPPIQVEIVVVDGDFPGSNSQDWNTDEFNRNIKIERKGRRPLLVGECLVTLHEGIASFGALKLTDNSSWVRSRKFRLGVRVSPNSYVGARIKEAITECFIVYDQRGKLNQKFYPPSLHDQVWRLDNIGRNGAFDKRLATAGIETVQDFLKLLVVDQQRLQKIMKMSGRMWDETIEHARTCRMEDDAYLYRGQSSTYTPEQLNPQQKANVQKPVNETYRNWEQLDKVDGIPSIDTIGAQEQEPHNWNRNSPQAANSGSQNGFFPSSGASANVLEPVPTWQIANAQNPVPPETHQNGNQLVGTHGMSPNRITEAYQNNHVTRGGLESIGSPCLSLSPDVFMRYLDQF